MRVLGAQGAKQGSLARLFGYLVRGLGYPGILIWYPRDPSCVTWHTKGLTKIIPFSNQGRWTPLFHTRGPDPPYGTLGAKDPLLGTQRAWVLNLVKWPLRTGLGPITRPKPPCPLIGPSHAQGTPFLVLKCLRAPYLVPKRPRAPYLGLRGPQGPY